LQVLDFQSLFCYRCRHVVISKTWYSEIMYRFMYALLCFIFLTYFFLFQLFPFRIYFVVVHDILTPAWTWYLWAFLYLIYAIVSPKCRHAGACLWLLV
jgi:hypothetical protein